MIKLVVKRNVALFDDIHDIVVTTYASDVTVNLADFPDCQVIPFDGSISDLERLGPVGPDPSYDQRPMLAPETIDLVLYAKAHKKLVEQGGIALGGEFVDTTVSSQNRLSSAQSYLDASGDESVTFESADGSSIVMPAAQLKAIALAVGRHVQGCFRVLGEVKKAIAAGEITTIAEVDAAFAALTA